MKKNLGIYIHIPFCVRKCAYCDFLSAPAGEEVQERYIEALRREIQANADLFERYQVSTLFFGGGTPSILKADALMSVLREIKSHFTLLSDAEITVECNPGTLDREKLRIYGKEGVNRLSIGLQSAHDEELRMLGRIHTWEAFLESYQLAREEGFSNINVDLMSALPGQTLESWKDTLYQVLRLKPEHISAYSLIVEEGTPFYERYEKGELNLPDEDTERLMYYETRRILAEEGFHRYEISNYAREGFESRHNSSYWERIDYKGFGLGAASLVEGVRYQNQVDLAAYLSGDFTYESKEVLTHQEELEETMFLGLRMMKGVRLNEELCRTYDGVFADLEEKGLLVREKESVRLTERGIDVSNYALSEFLLEEE